MAPPQINRQTTALLDAVPVPMLITSWDNGTAIHVNRAAVTVLGDVTGRPITDLYVTPSRRDELVAELARVGSVADFEVALRDQHGAVRTVLLAATPVVYEGQPAIYSIISDITGQKELESTLRERETQYRQQAENSADVTWQTDLEVCFTYVSPSVKPLFGYEPDDLRGKSLLDLLSASSRDYATARLKDRLAEEQTGKRTQPRLLELEIRHASGKMVNSEVTVNPRRAADGTLIGFQGMTRDVSDRVRIDERMRQSERNYRELVERTNCFILRWRADGVITFANTHTCEFFGFLPEELVGRHMVGTIVPETENSGQNLRELILEIGSNPEAFRNAEYENMRWDGSRVWIAWANAPAYDAKGRLLEILSVGHDVSERRQREQQLAYLTVFDPMSGLYNRAYFDTELERLARGRTFPISVVIASLENLQQLNDLDGREAGDLLLMKTARLLKEAFRAEDLVARTGGDGFAIILPGLDEQQTTATLIRFRNELAQASRELPEVSLCMGAGTAHTGSELQRAQREASAAMAAEKMLRKKQREQQETTQSKENQA